jgi:hypothetical protein
MASDHPLRPGARSGISHILTEAFGVSERPTLDRAEVARHIEQALHERELTYQKLYISDAPVHRGALFDAAGKRVPFPPQRAYDRCFVALVDPDQNARWSHPAYWAFVPADGGGEIEIRDTSLPEHDKGPVRLERWK